jgi:8-oxo-dGTP diphosphatase
MTHEVCILEVDCLSFKHVPRKTALGTKGLILNRDKILILVKPNGYFDLPGGKVEINESFTNCIHREVYEETALSVSLIRPVAWWSFFKKGVGFKINGITYLCSCLDSKVSLGNEHENYFWTDSKDILKLKFYPSYGLNQISQQTIRKWQENGRFWSLPQIK